MSVVEIQDRVPKGAPTSLGMITPSYAGRYLQNQQIPKYKLAESEIAPNVAYQLIDDELSIDYSPHFMNLSSFVTSWMEPEADRLLSRCQNMNLIDIDQYGTLNDIHERVICIISDLLNATKSAYGTSTAGSSEACLLAGLALKIRWQQRMTETDSEVANESDRHPNLVISKSGHFIWKKFCDWFNIELRQVSPDANDIHVSASSYGECIDQDTIGVVLIMGTTLSGYYEPIKSVTEHLQEIAKDRDIEVPIHVDAAIGGFYAPFVDDHIVWDFRLDQVVSINLSGHKYGLTYPGVGWLIFRSKQYCPEQVRYRLDYATTESHDDLSMSLTRPAGPIIAQYYNFLRLGRQGYSRIMTQMRSIARYLYDTLQKSCADVFRQLHDPSTGLPILVMTSAEGSDIPISKLSRILSIRGWIVPTYQVPYADHHIDVLRIVVREGFSRDHAEILFTSIMECINEIRREEPQTGMKKGRHGTRKRKLQLDQDQARIKHSIC